MSFSRRIANLESSAPKGTELPDMIVLRAYGGSGPTAALFVASAPSISSNSCETYEAFLTRAHEHQLSWQANQRATDGGADN